MENENSWISDRWFYMKAWFSDNWFNFGLWLQTNRNLYYVIAAIVAVGLLVAFG